MRLATLLGRDVLYLPCRRHIYEVWLAVAFYVSVEQSMKSEGPTIKIFETFKTEYFCDDFDDENYADIYSDVGFLSMFTAAEIAEILEFCNSILPKLKKLT